MTRRRWQSASALVIVGAVVTACGDSGPAWIRTCVPASYGRITHAFDGLSVSAADARAQKEGMYMYYRANDGSCLLSGPAYVDGRTYVNAAIVHDRVVFARIKRAGT
jgi:hypothetical protein